MKLKSILTLTCIVFAIGGMLILALQITSFSKTTSSINADVAIVLGAAVINEKPSPVFEQRIAHGIHLYQAKQVDKLIFTGGVGDGDTFAESEVGKMEALAAGVDKADIFIETTSKITQENLANACRLMRANGLKTALIVSDPLHMKRAITIASDINLNAYPSPTTTSAYKTWRTKLPSLIWEITFLTLQKLQFKHAGC